MTQVGLPIAVANAHELVKEKSCMVTEKAGGHGAVREACDFILKAQDKGEEAMKSEGAGRRCNNGATTHERPEGRRDG